MRKTTGRTRRHSAAVLVMVLAFAVMHGGMAGAGQTAPQTKAQTTTQSLDTWELRVCAPGDAMPFSNRQAQGFENLVMDVLAEEMHATLSYQWLPDLRNAQRDLQLLREGACDVFLDVGSGKEPYLSTLDYYQSTYVFVGRPDVLARVPSLTLASIQGLKVGVMISSPPDVALGVQGPTESLVHYLASVPHPEERMVEDLLSGALDLAILWGPPAAYYVAQHADVLALEPVTPVIDANGVAMVQTGAMGVRPGDLELRDLLNAAIARRWADIQAALAALDVPTVPLPEPVASLDSDLASSETAHVGVILPLSVGSQSLDPYGEAFVADDANMGATLALEDLPGYVAQAGGALEVLIASAPGAEAAARAADRMRVAEGAFAIVGGFGDAEAEALSEVAEARDMVFVNVAAQGDELRARACQPHGFHANTFHVAPSVSAYAHAIVRHYASDGARDFTVVWSGEHGGAGRLAALERAVRDQLGAAGSVEEVRVEGGQPLYEDAFEAIAATGPDLVILALDAYDQFVFLGQYAGAAVGVPIVGYPEAATQTRAFLAASIYDAPSVAFGDRVASWDAQLVADGAEAFNDRILRRFGRAAEPAAWSTYAGIKVLADAMMATGTTEAHGLVSYLSADDTSVDVLKGDATRFDPATHQLLQPLYLVAANPDADPFDARKVDLTVVKATLTDSLEAAVDVRGEVGASASTSPDACP